MLKCCWRGLDEIKKKDFVRFVDVVILSWPHLQPQLLPFIWNSPAFHIWAAFLKALLIIFDNSAWKVFHMFQRFCCGEVHESGHANIMVNTETVGLMGRQGFHPGLPQQSTSLFQLDVIFLNQEVWFTFGPQWLDWPPMGLMVMLRKHLACAASTRRWMLWTISGPADPSHTVWLVRFEVKCGPPGYFMWPEELQGARLSHQKHLQCVCRAAWKPLCTPVVRITRSIRPHQDPPDNPGTSGTSQCFFCVYLKSETVK